jgi:hypothetical protein
MTVRELPLLRKKRFVFAALTIVVPVLTGCGGGAVSDELASSRGGERSATSPGVAPSELELNSLLDTARSARCASDRNTVYVIDNTMALWDRAGQCPDNASEQVLYAFPSSDVKCAQSHTLAGPAVRCNEATDSQLFETMLHNLDSADLGLGAGHLVSKIDLLAGPKPNSSLDTLLLDSASAVSVPRIAVARDANALAALWAENYAGRVSPDLPVIDFSKKMVFAVFGGHQEQGCRTVRIYKVLAPGGQLEVHYQVRDQMTFAACAEADSAPVAMVVIDLSDEPVSFVNDDSPQKTMASVLRS